MMPCLDGYGVHLTKPFERMDLVQAIQTRLAKKAALEQNHQRDVEQSLHANVCYTPAIRCPDVLDARCPDEPACPPHPQTLL